MRRAQPLGYVYFLRPIGKSGPVKIGHSKVPYERLLAYQAISPVALEVVATVPGSTALEGSLHALFQHDHSHHEWFHGSPKLDETIAALADGSFDYESLPPPISGHRITARRHVKQVAA